MNYEQASKLVSRVSAAYPRHRFSPETAAIYVDMLSDLDYEQTNRTVTAIIAESDFPPSIAEIRRRVATDTLGLPEPKLAWELVVRRWGEHDGAGDKTVTLPAEVKSALAVAGIEPYRYWTADNHAFLRRDFIDVYSAIHARLLRAKNLGIEDAWTHQLDSGPALPQLSAGDAAEAMSQLASDRLTVQESIDGARDVLRDV